MFFMYPVGLKTEEVLHRSRHRSCIFWPNVLT